MVLDDSLKVLELVDYYISIVTLFYPRVFKSLLISKLEY